MATSIPACSDGDHQSRARPRRRGRVRRVDGDLDGLGLQRAHRFRHRGRQRRRSFDIVLNSSGESADAAGVLTLLTGRGDGTFGSEPFAMAGGGAPGRGRDRRRRGRARRPAGCRGRPRPRDSRVVEPPVADEPAADHIPTGSTLVNDLIDIREACITIPVSGSSDSRPARIVGGHGRVAISGRRVEWGKLDAAEGDGSIARGRDLALTSIQLSVSDDRGAVVTRALAVTVTGPGPRSSSTRTTQWTALVTRGWLIVNDASAAAGVAATTMRISVGQRSPFPRLPNPRALSGSNSSPTRPGLYKLWLRLKADGNHCGNDSVWVQFSGATNIRRATRPIGSAPRRAWR